MRRWILMAVAALLLLSQGALAAPTYEGTDQNPGQKPPAMIWHRITLDTSTTQSRNFALGQSCSVKFTKVGAGNVVLYEVPTSSAAYTSGVAETTFTASTTEAYTFKPGSSYGTVRAASDSDGSIVEISCLNDGTFSGGGGGAPAAEYAALSSIDETEISHVTVIDCDDLTCAAPGTGSTRVPFYYNGSAWVPFPGAAAGIASVSADSAPVLGNDLDADNYGIDNISWWGRYGDTAATTEAELEAAIAACGVGVGSGSVSTGCEIAFCGEIETDGITVGGATLAEAKSGVHIIGCGASQDNTTPARLAGAKLTYSDATGGGAVLTINGCKHCTFSGFDIDGNNADAGSDATAGISILGTAWGTSFTEFKGVTIENVNGYAIDVDSSSTDKQTDSMRFSEVSMRDNVGCYRSQSTQALLNIFINSECSTSTGTTLFDILEGMLILQNAYIGNAVNSSTLFKLGDAAHNFYITGSHIELGATTGNTVFADGTGTSNITERMRRVESTQITYSGASNVIFNVQRRGAWTIDGLTLFSSGTDVATTSTFANPPGSGLNRLTLELGNNYQRSADSGQSIVPEVWYPSTIGSAVIVKEAPIAAANLPEDDGGGDDKCRLGHIGIDTDATGAAKWKLCTANDTWTGLPDMSAIWTAAHDFGGATLEIPNSTTLPATCAVGQVYMDTDATSGQRIYACESSNTWTLQGDGGAGGGYATVDDEDTPLTQRTTLNFEGAGVTCVDDTDQTTCTIPGGSAGTVDTANSPGANEFARFTDADTIEGRTVSETRSDLGLATDDDVVFNSVETADPGDGDRGVTMLDNGTALVNLDTLAVGECRLGFVGGDVHKHCEGGSLTAVESAATIPKHTECFPFYAPTDTIADSDDVQSLWRAPAAITITEVWCETDTGTVNMDLQIDDGTPADVMGTDLVCASTAVSDSSGLTGSMADGDRLDLAITSVASSPTRLTVCAEYTYD